MAESARRRRAQRGDVIVISGHRVGEPERLGEIIAVLGEPGQERCRVRWDDDRKSVFYPGSNAHVRPARARSRRR